MKAVITAAAPAHRHIPHQTLTKADGSLQSILDFQLDLLQGSADAVAIVVPSGDASRFAAAASRPRVTLIEQPAPRGYADAVLQAAAFTGSGPFVHLVGDHFYLADSGEPRALVRALVRLHGGHGASITAVQPTRESLLPYFGAVAGPAVPNDSGDRLYQVETVLEKPTPTEAEGALAVPGLRAGQYLCFFGVHVFTGGLMAILTEHAVAGQPLPNLSAAMAILARRERLLAAILPGRRFDAGTKYGLLQAQLALALSGPDRAEILAMMLEHTAR